MSDITKLEPITAEVAQLTAPEFRTERKTLPFDLRIERKDGGGCSVTLVDLDNFLSLGRRNALERMLAIVVEAQLAEDEAEARRG